MAKSAVLFLSVIHHAEYLLKSITPQITGVKKQSEAALFSVRVHLPCYVVF